MDWKKLQFPQCEVITTTWNYGDSSPHRCKFKAVWENKESGRKICWRHMYVIEKKNTQVTYMKTDTGTKGDT